MKHTRRYIDDDGVMRGYYVYAHSCRKTGEVFYVGKGYGKRAWSEERSTAWQEKVESLPEGYEVRLLHTDLTDYESKELERSEIANHGGCAAEGGTLTNWLPCDPTMDLSCAISIELPNNLDLRPAQEAAEAAFPRFKPYDKKKSRDVVATWQKLVGHQWEYFFSWYWAKYQDNDVDDWPEPPEIYDTFQNDVRNIVDLVNDLVHPRSSWVEP